MVRFKHSKPRGRIRGHLTSFNSTMVRFKHGGRSQCTRMEDLLFQFHDGSIQAENLPTAFILILISVSIPRWFDSSMGITPLLTAISLTEFQFHDGSIQAERNKILSLSSSPVISIPRWFDSSILRVGRGSVRFILHVSIPRWFDSSSVCRVDHCDRDLVRFNSTMVRFKRGFQTRTIGYLGYRFQFHDGSIQASRMPGSFLRTFIVSIPRWFDSSPAPRW